MHYFVFVFFASTLSVIFMYAIKFAYQLLFFIALGYSVDRRMYHNLFTYSIMDWHMYYLKFGGYEYCCSKLSF